MAKVLVKTNYNWADEANFPSFAIIDDTLLSKIKEDIKNYFDKGGEEFVRYVGTNEDIAFSSYDEVFDSSFEEISINDDELKVLKKAFGEGYKGNIMYGECTILDVYESLNDSDDSDDEFEDSDEE